MDEMTAVDELVSGFELMAGRQDVFDGTHGNLSVRVDGGSFVIKPSGVPFAEIGRGDVVTAAFLPDGRVDEVRGVRRPSVDTPEHAAIYAACPNAGAICHSHSRYVVAHAINGFDVMCRSTEQADEFGGSVVCVPFLDFEWGVRLVRHALQTFRYYDGDRPHAFVLGRHGAVTFAVTATAAVAAAVSLERVAEKNFLAATLGHALGKVPDALDPAAVRRWNERYTERYGQR